MKTRNELQADIKAARENMTRAMIRNDGSAYSDSVNDLTLAKVAMRSFQQINGLHAGWGPVQDGGRACQGVR